MRVTGRGDPSRMNPARLSLTCSHETKMSATSQPLFPVAPPVRVRKAFSDRVAGHLGAKTTAPLVLGGIFLHLLLRFGWHVDVARANQPLFAALFLGGLPLLISLVERLLSGEFGSDFLAGISIITAVLLKEYLAGSIVVLMLAGGTALEEFATRRASRVLDTLASRMPSVAHRKADHGHIEVALKDIRVGDLLVVLPHEICPADGVVVEGHGSMNEAYLTGEPYEVGKAPGVAVLSGALNSHSMLVIRTEKLPVDSRFARIMRVMEETQQRRPQIRRLGDTLGAWYTPLALVLATAAWLWSGDADRFLAVLVVATPCPLLIAIPVAIIGAVSLAARRGVIIKNPAILEQIGSCRTFIFDKTGTLTYGKPSLTQVVCPAEFDEDDVLTLAACLERYSKHPLASAILDAAQARGCSLSPAACVSERPGEGLRGSVNGHDVSIIGRTPLLESRWPLPPVESGLECLIFVDQRYAGLFRFQDVPRHDSRIFVSHLSPRHHVSRIILLSGDREAEVRALAARIGIAEAHGAKTPEEKVAMVHAEASRQKTAFVGDGINDAPAMQAATAGIAFGHENEVTSEAADAVILERSFQKVDELIHIGRRMKRIALQSAVGGMILSTAGMVIASFGGLPPIGGAIAQEAIDLVAVLNAVRAAVPFRHLRDF